MGCRAKKKKEEMIWLAESPAEWWCEREEAIRGEGFISARIFDA